MPVEKPNVDIELNTVDRAENPDSAGPVPPCPDPMPESAPADEHEPSNPPSHAVDMNNGEHQADSQPSRQRHTRPGMPGRDGKKEDDTRFFGIPKYQSHFVGGAAGDRSYNYEEKYPADEPYHEAGDNARVWKVYLDEAEIYDDDMVRGFRDTIDSLLVFAALFSAVVTTFVVQTSQVLQPDYNQYSSRLLYEQIQLLRANGNSSVIVAVPSNPASPEPSYTRSDIWVNGLFYTSLALSLSTALLSVLAKQWIQAYTSVTSGTAKSRALVRQFRFTGLTKWRLPEIVGILPLLLHASLAIFLIGLSVYVHSLHSSLSWALIVTSGLTFLFYLASLFLPAVWINCPYRITILYNFTQAVLWPFRCIIHLIMKGIHDFRVRRNHCSISRRYRPRYLFPKWSGSSLQSAEINAIKDSRYPGFRSNHHDRIILDALLWLHELSSNPTVIRAAARAVAGLPLNFCFMRNIRESQIEHTVSAQLLASADRDLSDGNESFTGDWIRASLNMKLINIDILPRNSEAMDTFVLGLPQLVHLRESYSTAAGMGNVNFVKHYIHSWSMVFIQNGYYHGLICDWKEMAVHPICNWEILDIPRLRSNIWSDELLNLCEKLQHDTNLAVLVALRKGKSDIVKLLMEKGINMDANGKYEGEGSESFLYTASKDGHLDVLKVLLETGADVNAQGGKFGNALQVASSEGHMDVVKLLLENGADANAQGSEFGNALQAASYRGRLDVVKLLLETGADVNAQGGEYGNALQAASYRGRLDVVKLLLEKGADVNAQGGKYGNPLQAASYGGSLDTMKLLLEKGADVNAQGGEYGNALQAASYDGSLDVVKLLLEKGADMNAQSGEYGTALIAASSRAHPDIVELLIERGADVNMRPNGKTALQAAIEEKQEVQSMGWRYEEESMDKVISILRANGATGGE